MGISKEPGIGKRNLEGYTTPTDNGCTPFNSTLTNFPNENQNSCWKNPK